MMDTLRIIFPVLMVIGAMGSMMIEAIQHGLTATYIHGADAAERGGKVDG